MDWEVTGSRPCDVTQGCEGRITTERRQVFHTMHVPSWMGDEGYETVTGYDWAESCDTCDWNDAEPYTY